MTKRNRCEECDIVLPETPSIWHDGAIFCDTCLDIIYKSEYISPQSVFEDCFGPMRNKLDENDKKEGVKND